MVLFAALLWAAAVVRPRRSSHSLVALCPKAGFVLTFVMLFLSQAAMTSLLPVVKELRVSPAIVGAVFHIGFRALSMMARLVFRNLQLPLVVYSLVCFACDTTMLIALRRYWLALPSFHDAVTAVFTNAGMELFCNFTSGAMAVYNYNDLVSRGRTEIAVVYINMCCTAIVSQVIAEHVAIHSCFAYELYVDTRVFAASVQAEKANVVAAWGLSLLVEVVVDGFSLLPIVLLFPVSFRGLLFKLFNGWPAVLNVACCCAHPHFIGLHTYVHRARFFCD
eukprot:UN1479